MKQRQGIQLHRTDDKWHLWDTQSCLWTTWCQHLLGGAVHLPAASDQVLNQEVQMYRAASFSSCELIAEVCHVRVACDAGQAAAPAYDRADRDEVQSDVEAAASSDEERMPSAESEEEEELESDASSSSSDDGRYCNSPEGGAAPGCFCFNPQWHAAVSCCQMLPGASKRL